MSKSIGISSHKIAEIKNALTIIQLNAQQIPRTCMSSSMILGETARLKMTKNVLEQVKRIDRLLPQIKYEKEGKCHVTK